MDRCCYKVLLAFLILIAVNLAGCEVFTALSDMEEVLETEKVLMINLKEYISVQEKKIKYLKRKFKIFEKEHSKATSDVSEYLLNPINAFLLTKRLTKDWKVLEQIMLTDVGSQLLNNLTYFRTVLKFPSEEDLTGAANTLTRLQDTYNLKTSSLASGELNGVQYGTTLNSDDCFEIGRQMYNNQDYRYTVLWMTEALNRLNDGFELQRLKVLEYLAFSMFKEGKVELALELTEELLKLDPDHLDARKNRNYFKKELQKQNIESDQINDELQQPISSELSERELYELACRGELKPTDEFLSKLHCRYVTNNTPFLKIAPLKLEQVAHDPYIVVFHEVIYDKEIEIIKELAKPNFQRATVMNPDTGEFEVAKYRVSKSAWLMDEEHKVVRTVVQRVFDMTGLSVRTAEDLQVVNYGIGGHYECHYDFARKEEINAFKNLGGSGNRLATVLFYLSDVTQGGATVFPLLKTAVWPKKGTAAFWFNLRKSGQGDYLTKHAACPVIVGSKWVANKWIHEGGNEFERQCGLEIDDEVKV